METGQSECKAMIDRTATLRDAALPDFPAVAFFVYRPHRGLPETNLAAMRRIGQRHLEPRYPAADNGATACIRSASGSGPGTSAVRRGRKASCRIACGRAVI